jgi:hypothetical protein
MRKAEGGSQDNTIGSFTSPIFGHRPSDSIFAVLLNPRFNVGPAINDAGAGLFATKNAGVADFGVRVGYRF